MEQCDCYFVSVRRSLLLLCVDFHVTLPVAIFAFTYPPPPPIFALLSLFLLHFCFCLLATGIGRVSFGAFLGRCAVCKSVRRAAVVRLSASVFSLCHRFVASFSVLSTAGPFVFFVPSVMLLIPLWSHFSFCEWLQHIKTSSSSASSRSTDAVFSPPVRSLRLVVHHHLAFPVEGVRHHAGQLSSSLHNQIPEAQVFTAELLQTVLLIRRRVDVLYVCAAASDLPSALPLIYPLVLSDGQVTCQRSGNHWNNRKRGEIKRFLFGFCHWDCDDLKK